MGWGWEPWGSNQTFLLSLNKIKSSVWLYSIKIINDLIIEFTGQQSEPVAYAISINSLTSLNHFLYCGILNSFSSLLHLSPKYRHFLSAMFRVHFFSLYIFFTNLLPSHNFKYHLYWMILKLLSKHQSYTPNNLLFTVQNKPEVTLNSIGAD